MKAIISSLMFLFFLFMIISCKKDFLDKAPDDDLNIDQVFANRDYANNFLSNIYAQLPREAIWADNAENPYHGAADELKQHYPRSFCNNMTSGTWDPNSTDINPWARNYGALRKANLFIEHIDKVPLDQYYTQAARDRQKGEAIFLRAFFHFLLVRVYGPVPIADSSVSLDANFKAIRRQPMDKCVAYIVSQCDQAAALLPARITEGTEYGRVPKSAALALKARVLLYMASPLFNGNPDYANFKDDEGNRLFPDYQASRWQAAADAAKDCINQTEAAGYGLYFSAGNNPVKNYQELFYINNNKEVLWANNEANYYNQGFYDGLDVYNETISLSGFALHSPTQDMVDQYEMANGLRPITGYTSDHSPIINPLSGYTETGFTNSPGPNNLYVAGTSNMYVNREPRFYASINFSGAVWKTRTNGLEYWFKGADGKLAGGSDHFVETGYLLKKLSDPNFVWRPVEKTTLRTWIYFRLGEQYLNYAEALNEAQGPVPDVYKYINLIRNRAGLPGLPAGLSKDDMRERVHHERQIELAFESQRYFDNHRWKMSEITDNTNIYGLNIYAGESKTDPAFFKRRVVERRIFQKKHYLWPMLKTETDKNPKLVQNPGW
ncbi:RagB/SusD family nutrient uptake outer membrane protein [Chitinophaga sp. 180180018-2]|nr:RagB/SusD family nutrient uptake outer membrane protein [Chitinophaga sp. 212800010-3]